MIDNYRIRRRSILADSNVCLQALNLSLPCRCDFLACVAGVKRGVGGRKARKNHPLLPFSPPPYPLPFSTTATQAIACVQTRATKETGDVCTQATQATTFSPLPQTESPFRSYKPRRKKGLALLEAMSFLTLITKFRVIPCSAP